MLCVAILVLAQRHLAISFSHPFSLPLLARLVAIVNQATCKLKLCRRGAGGRPHQPPGRGWSPSSTNQLIHPIHFTFTHSMCSSVWLVAVLIHAVAVVVCKLAASGFLLLHLPVVSRTYSSTLTRSASQFCCAKFPA